MAGKLQNEDFKTEAELTGAGGSASQLLNDTKIYVTANSINKTLDDAITDGDIGGGSGTTTRPARYSTNAGNTVANSTVTYIDFEDQSFDPDSISSGQGAGNVTTTNTGFRLIMPEAGYVQVNTGMRFVASSEFDVGESIFIGIYKNGVQQARVSITMQASPASFDPSLALSDIVEVAASDYIEIAAFHDSGPSTTVSVGNNSSWVSVAYV